MSTLQRLHGLPNSGASLTARHPLEPKILSHAEGDNFSPISYPPEASGYSPSGYLGELPLKMHFFFYPPEASRPPPLWSPLTARHPLEPNILSQAEDDKYSRNSYPPEASGYAPSGGYIVELIGHVCDTRIIYLVPGKTACMILYNTITALTAVLHADLSCGRTSSDSTLVPVSVLEIVVGSLLHHGRVDFRSKSG